jgi:hypothetical protein
MHSLPFISHHLFVAAIGSESRPPERPIREPVLREGTTTPVTAIPLDAPGSRRFMPAGQTRLLRAPLARARG